MVKTRKLAKYQPILIALISFGIFIFIILKYTEFNREQKEKDIKGKLLEILNTKKSQLEKSLYSRIYYTKGIAAYVTIHPNISNEVFYNLSNELINNDTVINSMALSKDCILGAIYPLTGHESAIGLNLLEHPNRKKIVESTIKTKNTFVAGPVELVEGGIAFISYTPIFTKIPKEPSKFWGVTDIVILNDKLFNEIKLYDHDANYKYALKGTDGSGITGECFWGDSKIFDDDPVVVNVLLPTGNWAFACVPVNGWESLINKTEILTIVLYLCSIIISVLIWLLTKAILKIRANERELKALFGSMQDLIIEFDKNGRYVKIAPTNESLLIRPAKELLGKTMYEVFDKDTADYFVNAIRECLNLKKLVIIDYPLEINSLTFWFQARLSYISEETVIYVAHDNTYKMKVEEKLRQSEKELIELNATKDMFFSIIAHDLKNPLGVFRNMTKLLIDTYAEFTEEERIDFLKLIKDSANNIYSLLENLLEWSRSQRGLILYNPIHFDLFDIVNNTIKILKPSADNKRIIINNSIKVSTFIVADNNMITTIIRNLISNAINYTFENGEISINAIIHSDYIQISVKDTGMGMTQENIQKLFRIDTHIVSVGTNMEKGTGLGLILCKEFVEKHRGRIWVESDYGKGSTFLFTLPIVNN